MYKTHLSLWSNRLIRDSNSNTAAFTTSLRTFKIHPDNNVWIQKGFSQKHHTDILKTTVFLLLGNQWWQSLITELNMCWQICLLQIILHCCTSNVFHKFQLFLSPQDELFSKEDFRQQLICQQHTLSKLFKVKQCCCFHKPESESALLDIYIWQ